jgi:hypothetical protein
MSMMDFEANMHSASQAALMPAPTLPKPKNERSAWRAVDAIVRAVPVAAGELAAGVADVATGSARQLREAARVKSPEETRKQAREGLDWDSENELSRSIRGGLDVYRPDPATASTAESFVFEAARVLGKGVGLALTTGPAAIPLLATSEGMEATDKLQQMGVSNAAAQRVGVVTALATGAGAAIPVAPALAGMTAGNIAKVVGLAGVSGPATFMAQQQMTRDILSAANYADIAKQYDPLDPWGLALSMAPGLGIGLATLGMRGAKTKRATDDKGQAQPAIEPVAKPPEIAAKPEPVSQETVDSAMVHNLTLMRDAQVLRGAESPPADSASVPPGGATKVVTERGMQVPVQYKLVEADTLVTSHGNDLTANPAFPAELQPRDRARAASADQVARIENQINPELLGESVKASDGAPIIGPDSVVESGNARTIALRRAYESGKADTYRAWLEGNAARFGLTAENIQGMKRPVLVRERVGDVDRAEFARQANESPIASLSPVEQARADAGRMKSLDGLVPNNDGGVNMAQSGAWVRSFMQSVPPTERGALMQSDGQLSQAGVQRIRNAVFAKAYGDPDILAALSESTNSNIKNILAGLMRAAPEVARMQDLIASGARQPMDFAPDLVRAVRELSDLRARGVTVDQFLAQGSLIEGGLSPELNNLLVGLSENARAPKRIAEMVKSMVQAVDNLGDPRQGSLLDNTGASRADVAADAVERMRTLTDEQLTDTEPETFKPSTDPLMRSVADRVAMVEATAPDMAVRIREDGTPVTVAEEMAQARREAMEGTDTELGAADADLVRVAADCALTFGD